MDGPIVEDEKKPFDAEGAPIEEETLPDPDEQLMLHQGNGRVWLVKVGARHLYFDSFDSVRGVGSETSYGALVRYRCRERPFSVNASVQRSQKLVRDSTAYHALPPS